MARSTMLVMRAAIASGAALVACAIAPTAAVAKGEKEAFVRQCPKFELPGITAPICACLYDLFAKKRMTEDEIAVFSFSQLKDNDAVKRLVAKHGQPWAASTMQKITSAVMSPDFDRCFPAK